MKKGLAIFLILLLVCVIGFYFFVPSPAVVTREAWMNADKNLIQRALTSQSLVQKWWPDSGRRVTPAAGGHLQIETETALFTVVPASFDLVRVDITKGATTIQGFITILPTQHDSTAISWKAELPERGVFGKLQNQLLARSLKRDMATVLERLHRFVQNQKSIYGFTVKEETVSDTLLVVTKEESAAAPGVETYYGLLKKLRAYIAAQGAQETNFPMLHISQKDSTTYETTVAIPINKHVPDNGAILLKRMIRGKILVAEVSGGPQAVEEGIRQMDFYITDQSLRQPGMPFQSLLTDRLAQRDSTKWITKLYYPVL